MNKRHAKKRNSLLLYEFLTRKISSALIEGNSKQSSLALKILKKAFKPGTQLYNEFRIMNALAKTTVKSEGVACSIISEAKRAIKLQDVDRLDREKSYLIKNINHQINDNTFFDQHVGEYKMYATIQTLFNEYRSVQPYIETLASHEDSLVKWLTTERATVDEQALSDQSPGTNRLVMKIMMTKLNEKYSDVLTEPQKNIVREYVWSTTNDNAERIKNKLTETRDELLGSLQAYVNENQGNEYLLKQLSDVQEKLINEDVSVINDELITRFMNYMKLDEEFNKKDDK